jgi:hypothetical protein
MDSSDSTSVSLLDNIDRVTVISRAGSGNPRSVTFRKRDVIDVRSLEDGVEIVRTSRIRHGPWKNTTRLRVAGEVRERLITILGGRG